jgi:hypothetical protein
MQIKKFTLIGGLLLGFLSVAYAQNRVSGVIYEDLNRNGKRERSEKGIPNVAISNNVDVVLTNAKGEYSLPVANDNIIFVIKPSTHTVPVNELNQPQFYYIHKPNGSPELKYAGTSPTGPLPKSLDFPLIPIQEKEQFTMLVFGDPQPYNETEVDYFYRGLVKEVENIQGVEFGISLGDMVGDNLDLHIPYKKAIKHAGIPWYNVMGNHDENYDVTADSLSDETFERNFGPANYAFNHGNVHFIVLDDILYPDPRDQKSYWGGFRKDQLDFVENDLKLVPKDKLIVLAFHIPLNESEGGDPFRDADRERLFQILKDFPFTLSMSAHTHYQEQVFLGKEFGWLQDKPHHHFNVGASCGDWYSGKPDANGVPLSTMRDGTPKGYVFLKFDGNNYAFDYKVAGKPANQYFEIYAPKVVGHNIRSSAGIYANFFIGSPNDQVSYRIGDGEWKPMQRVVEPDPTYLHLLHEWDFSDKVIGDRRPSNPVDCQHLWRAAVPTNLPVGLHTIEVKAVDMFGRTLTQKSSYRIAER